MTRPYVNASERREQAKQLLKPEGVTLQQIAAALGYANVSNASAIMSTLEFAGLAFKCRAKIKEDTRAQSSETIYFPTQADLDRFTVAHQEEKRQQALARKKTQGYRTEYYAKRNEQRRLARQARVQAAYAERAKREAMKLAEAEQRKERARLEREARAAARAEAKAETERKVKRLKVRTKAAGQLAPTTGTRTAAAPKPRGPAFVAGDPVIPSGLEIKRLPGAPASRWGVESAPSVINSRECRTWAREAVPA